MGRAIAAMSVSAGALWPRPVVGLRHYLAAFWQQMTNPYRPELHYMRGPGPAWRAKHGGRGPV